MLRTIRILGLPRGLSHSRCRQHPEYDPRKLQQIIDTSNMGSRGQSPAGSKTTEELRRDTLKATSGSKSDSSVKITHNATPRVTSGVTTDPKSTSEATSDLNTFKKSTLENTGSRTPLVSSASVAGHTGLVDLKTRWADISRSLGDFYGRFQSVGQLLNDITGYSAIEQQKSRVKAIEVEIVDARTAVKQAKKNYEEAIRKWSDSQKEINELLTRKHNWSPQDVERFTELYKNDHQYQHEETTCKEALEAAEHNVDAVQLKLTQQILTRYHEEQLWSDKIRQASTWGTWMLMGVNILLFATATLVVEPWKRRRLVAAFQSEVQQKMDQQAEELHRLADTVEGGSKPASYSGKSVVFVDSWAAFKAWVGSLPGLLRADRISLDRPDFLVVSGVVFLAGWLMGRW